MCKGEGLVCSKVACVGESGWQCKQLSLLVYFVQRGFNEGMSNIGPQPNNSALLHNIGRLRLFA